MYYGYGYGYDSMYFLVLLAFIFSMVAQMKVSGTFKKYAKVRNRRGLTGAQVAEQMMHNAGIYDVSVQRVAGNLTDHYDPRTKTLRLSESVYDSTSVAAVGVAAHETGHAIQHDVDATNFGYPLGEIPQLGTLTFEADERLRSLAKKCCEEVNPDISVYEGRILTGDQFICDKNKKEWLSKTFNGSCTEMEGAAIAQAAYLNKIPFLIVRAISDKADDSASMDYPEFERQAIIHSTNLTRALILAY